MLIYCNKNYFYLRSLKMSSKKIAFYIPFNIFTSSGAKELTTRWISQRLALFMKYTRTSIDLQHTTPFMAYVVYHPSNQNLINNMLVEYPNLSANIQFISSKDYDTELTKYISNSEYFYEIHLDSDDFYFRNTVYYLDCFNPNPQTEAIIFTNGYLYDSISKKLTHCTTTCSSFYCLIYKTEDYLRGKRYNISHYTEVTKLHYQTLGGLFFIKHLHALNTQASINDFSTLRMNNLKLDSTPIDDPNKILIGFYNPFDNTIFSLNPPYQTKKIAFKVPFNIPLDCLVTSINEKSNLVIMDPKWIHDRIAIFMKYTLNSLKNQSNQSFMAYFLYYTPSEKLIMQELALYPDLPNNIRFIRQEDYDALSTYYAQNSKYYYEIEMGSDDLYHKNFVQYLYDYVPKPQTCILICQDGYILSSTSGELAEYFNYSSCFNCWIYHTSVYLKGIRYAYVGFVGAIKLRHEIIPWRAYINHSHSLNLAFSYEEEKQTPWGKSKAYIGRPISSTEEKSNLLKEFMGKS